MSVQQDQPTADIAPSPSAGAPQSTDPHPVDNSVLAPRIVVLLVLSANEESARNWVQREFQGFRIVPLPKSLLKWGSKREQLMKIRDLRPDAFAIFTADINHQTARDIMLAFGAATGASQVALGDAGGATIRRSRLSALIIGPLRLLAELVLGYLMLIPAAWCFTLLVNVCSRLRGPAANTARKTSNIEDAGLSVLYLRGSLAETAGGKTAGGMATHVAGFTGGALSLGHHLSFISSSELDLPSEVKSVTVVPPSLLFSATRTMFEVWNSLLFTVKALGAFRGRTSFDFIYQRYNRFNCTGVFLSALKRTPLILEYNGSEVWVARHWDPVGLMWLLKRFEKMNHRFACLIVVVAEAEKRNLLAAGVPEDRILVNPNGVDQDQFRPGAGGQTIRHRLGIDDKTVVGFIGTFGPWHGAEVLARAALNLKPRDRFHLLFVGDGDLRPAAQSVFEDAGCAQLATFVGRVPHEMAPAYLDACDVLASPHVPSADGSEFFGSPTKLFEYLASGKPVVASRLGQIGDIINDGETGFLITPGSVEELTDSLERLARDPALSQRIGANGRAMVASRFTWRHNAARIFDAFSRKTRKT